MEKRKKKCSHAERVVKRKPSQTSAEFLLRFSKKTSTKCLSSLWVKIKSVFSGKVRWRVSCQGEKHLAT
jgi:hypothetical protein